MPVPKWCAYENGRPSSPASCALNVDEPQQPHLGRAGRHRGGAQPLRDGGRGAAGGQLAQQVQHVEQLGREVLGAQALDGAAQRGGGHRVGARRAADAQVDPARVQRLQHRELLGDHQRRVVRQHDAAGADPDPLGRRGEVREQHAGGGRRDRGHAVVLGDPEPAVAQGVGARRASVVESASASALVAPVPTGDRSSTDRGTSGRTTGWCARAASGVLTSGATRPAPGDFPGPAASRVTRPAAAPVRGTAPGAGAPRPPAAPRSPARRPAA